MPVLLLSVGHTLLSRADPDGNIISHKRNVSMSYHKVRSGFFIPASDALVSVSHAAQSQGCWYSKCATGLLVVHVGAAHAIDALGLG